MDRSVNAAAATEATLPDAPIPTLSRRRELHRIVKKLGIKRRKSSATRHTPTLEVCEDERVLLMAMDVLDLIDIEVVLDPGPPAVLSIHGRRQFNEVERRGNLSIALRGLRQFEATVVLPDEVEEHAMEVCFEGSKLVIVAAKRLCEPRASRLHLLG